MSDHEANQESSDSLETQLNAIRPGNAPRQPNKQLTQANAALADMSAREADRRDHDRAIAKAREARTAFGKYHKKFGWTEAQFAEYWPLRGVRAFPGEKQSEWEKLLDRERKRVKAALEPNTNARVKDMTPEDAKAHLLKRVRKNVARHRAKAKAAASLEAALAGHRLLTDEELAVLEEAEASPSPPVVVDQQLEDLLASLKAAVDAEGK